ncbi:FERM domain-containing protein 4A [Homalodisca vitripennis]|nr:FERM domain-containing protein 4A [Homalodisca vitripennis]
MDYESPQPKVEMVASLQSRKDSLEAKLKEKNEELKALCIQEAELTGVLPPETPLEAGESPPVFRRRVGTVFTYPENLINKLKSKEEESLATLELEFNIQTGIAEAARSLANDSTASKAARRKHRVVYQQSQRRLLELEARLNLLRQASRCPLKQRKKPRPPLESEVDNGVSADMVNGVSLSPVQEKLYHQSHQMSKHQHQSLNLVTERSHTVPSRYSSAREPVVNLPLHNYNRNSHRQVHSEVPYTQNWAYQQYPREMERQQRINYDSQGNRCKEGNNWYNTAPTSRYLGVGTKPEEDDREKSVRYRDRFGSLDRRRGGGACSSVESLEPDLRQSPVHHRLYPPAHHHPPPTVLLPNQTYPENSLMHTQSVGSDHSSRRSKEKDWFETALDAGPRPTPTPPPIHPHHSGSEGDPAEIHLPVTQQLSFDTVVPFESPKNHTVVQAGMWQPYREVTKPFEMADFYKYSTKFRKNAAGLPPVPQQKALYQPLQPMTCQPLVPQLYIEFTLWVMLVVLYMQGPVASYRVDIGWDSHW